mmetsp:Transcript_23734/g.40606  ORF Transcript_23734/g.40606 Transcript_23734/m.40606 type:complete len:219 (+) Transcript_23734:344-1000(+)
MCSRFMMMSAAVVLLPPSPSGAARSRALRQQQLRIGHAKGVLQANALVLPRNTLHREARRPRGQRGGQPEVVAPRVARRGVRRVHEALLALAAPLLVQEVYHGHTLERPREEPRGPRRVSSVAPRAPRVGEHLPHLAVEGRMPLRLELVDDGVGCAPLVEQPAMRVPDRAEVQRLNEALKVVPHCYVDAERAVVGEYTKDALVPTAAAAVLQLVAHAI